MFVQMSSMSLRILFGCAGLGIDPKEEVEEVPALPSLTSLRRCFKRSGSTLPSAACSDSNYLLGLPEDVLGDIALFVAASPKELTHFTSAGAVAVQQPVQMLEDCLWQHLYSKRWPAFYDAVEFFGRTTCWRVLYENTIRGKHSVMLEVFHREKKKGFLMSALPARVHYSRQKDAYVVDYITSGRSCQELVPMKEGNRLRFCPTGAREELFPGLEAPNGSATTKTCHHGSVAYPDMVLSPLPMLAPGQSVEFQWKMQKGSPFGWWYAEVEAVLPGRGGEGCTGLLISFVQFAEGSKWKHMEVHTGDGHVHPSPLGGFTGGVRSLSEAEKKEWMHYAPSEPFCL